MRKSLILLIAAVVLVLSAFTQIRSVHATSCGFERYKDADCEVYLEYLPIVPVDLNNPSASEEWAFKFYVWQKNIVITPYILDAWPDGWSIDVYFRDIDDEDNTWTTWKRWYPISMSDDHLPVSWSLSGNCGPISLGTTITIPSSRSFETNYTKFPAYINSQTYMRVGYLSVAYGYYRCDGANCEGAGSLDIPNDLGAKHLGHHIKMFFRFNVRWQCCGMLWTQRNVEFTIGDDWPANTDCFITVNQGTTSFSTGGSSRPPEPNYGIPQSRRGIGCGGSRTCMPT